MATLNTQETDALRAVRATLESILRNGYDPKDESVIGRQKKLTIEKARDAVKTVVSMKGHYPT